MASTDYPNNQIQPPSPYGPNNGGLDPSMLAAMGLSNTIGGIFSGIGQAGAQNQQQTSNLQQTGIGALGNQQQFQQGQNLARQTAGLGSTQMDPLAQQKSREQQALLAAILPQLKNSQVQAPGALQAYTPQLSGGIADALPPGGLGGSGDGSLASFLSPGGRANAESTFWQNAAPFATPPDLSAVGYGSAGAGPNVQTQNARSGAVANQASQNQMDQNSLLAALKGQSGFQNQQAKSNGPGIGSTIAGGVMAALPYLMMLSHPSFKDRISAVDPEGVLEKLQALPINQWHYKGDEVAHIGPMADAFQQAFGVGDGVTLSVFDVLGVVLAAQKALAAREVRS